VRPDDPGSFADGLAAIRNHPAQAREMGRSGAAGVQQHYSVARMADHVTEIYSELLRRSPEPRRSRSISHEGHEEHEARRPS
jgi:glycosyltransferase involved in cell wall biosynthesis